jgi:DNA-binding PadR family transcriptional regulator
MADIARELLILGILRRGALSAYDLDRAVHGHAPLYRPLKSGNVYYALDRMAQNGMLLRRSAKTQRGPSPTKTMYRLAAAGEARFQALIRATLTDVQADTATLEVAYVLLGQLPRNDALDLVRERRNALEGHRRRLLRLLGDPAERDGAARIAFGHAFHRARSEQQFLREAAGLLEDPKWTPGWTSDDGPVVDPARML